MSDKNKRTNFHKSAILNSGDVIKCPVEYNGVRNDKDQAPNESQIRSLDATTPINKGKLLFTVDWLQIHYKGGLTSSLFDEEGLYIFNRTRLKNLDKPTQHFLNMSEVWVNGPTGSTP